MTAVLNRFRLKWKLTLVFGLIALLGVLACGYMVYGLALDTFDKQSGKRLLSAASALAALVDVKRLPAVHRIHDPYYIELKKRLVHFSEEFDLAWLALYRHNGHFYTHIVDGAEAGEEFAPDHPVFDTVPEMDQARAGQAAATKEYIDVYGSWRSAFYPVRDQNGQVIAIVDASMNNDDVAAFRQGAWSRSLRTASAVALVVLLACLVMAMAIGKPLEKLEKAARKIGQGDYAIRVPVGTRRDEIGQLQSSFNAMADDLQQSHATLNRKLFELQALFEVSRKVNHAKDSAELLQLTLEKALETMAAERGSVMLFDEEEGVLRCEVACGSGVGEGKPRIALRPGEGVAGIVFEQLRPIRLAEEVERFFKPYEMPVETAVRSILCVPLAVEGRAIGVINLVNRRDGSFNAADEDLLAAMAAQVSLTIEKGRLYELAVTDGLTGLYVHRYFQVALERELQRAKRYQKPISLLLFDIDHFKNFNDTYGHQGGDMVLGGTAAILRQALRNVDIAARYGGEEFAIILPETDAEGALLVAERVRKAIADHHFPGADHPLRVTVSIGVSVFPDHAAERLEMIRKADEALYVCKDSGRNCVRLAIVDSGKET